VRLPDGVLGMAARGLDWADFVDRLPALAAELFEDWELRPDGPLMHGYCALVAPVLTARGDRAALKIGFPDEESEHEHLALQRWNGHGAVGLFRADPRRRAMLLERLRAEDLTGLGDLAACEIVAGLYEQIHVPALPQLRTLTSYVGTWVAELTELPRSAPIPRRLVEQAISLARAFVADGASTGVMIHGDLHYENVLAGDRQPWLAVDPKPMNGDPHYELAPMLWNRFEELGADVRGGVRRRFHVLVDAAGLDEERARDWVVLREVLNAVNGLGDQDGDWLTACIAIAKAVQD
jgi:streptomycin 6-kinase